MLVSDRVINKEILQALGRVSWQNRRPVVPPIAHKEQTSWHIAGGPKAATCSARGADCKLDLLSHEQSGLGSRWHARRTRKRNRHEYAGNGGFLADRVCATRC
jgi:hypothetical protein